MQNIAINQAETILEPFWDTGESYQGHRKYSRITPYKIKTGENAKAKVRDSWCSVVVSIQKAGNREYDVSMERECSLDISDYDLMTVYAIIPRNIKITVNYTGDNVKKCAIDQYGTGGLQKLYGKISGQKLSSIELAFRGEGSGDASLFWVGLAKSGMLGQREPVSSFTDEWEGCFEEIAEDFSAEPSCNIYFDKEELPGLREKIRTEPFSSIYAGLKEKASVFMAAEPEKAIGTFYPVYSGQFGNAYGDGTVDCELNEGMMTLAFAGIVENDKRMLKMACRMALSAACCRYWCENIMGEFPGATWHHRSFTEYKICYACALVLDWAGSLLSWHGKNMIYNAMIMKGMPRIEADFKTMDYIYECNQGFMFNTGRVAALLALSKRFPRYAQDLEESEQFMYRMLEKTAAEDGGTIEGPGYWAAVIQNAFPTAYMLARYKGMTLEAYIPGRLRAIADYGLAVMSDFGRNYRFVPVSDTHAGSEEYTDVNAFTVAICARLSKDRLWQEIYHNADRPFVIYSKLEYLIMAEERKQNIEPVSYEGFRTLNYTGITSLRTKADDIGGIRLLICGGRTSETHSHGDKGHFVLEADGKPMIVDGGICGYGSAQTLKLQRAECHNILVPLDKEGIAYDQPRNVYGGRIRKAKYKDGCLNYSVDLKDAWEAGLFVKNIRNIISAEPCCYEIEDVIEFREERRAGFHIHTYDEILLHEKYYVIRNRDIQIRIIPVNYEPEGAEVLDVGIGSQWKGEPDNREYLPLKRLKIDLPECVKGTFINRLEIVRTTDDRWENE